jgi:hypothetical protein
MVGRWSLLYIPLGLFLLSVLPLQAQPTEKITIEGTVVDDSTGAPLPKSHVFVSGSMTGTIVEADGHFRLSGLSTGAKRLYVTRLGYKPVHVDLLLRSDTTLTFTFRLEPTVVSAEEVTVTAERSEEWYERLRHFKRLFIGESDRAQRCYLLNPKVLEFDTAWWGRFEADARRPLTFENWALGYRLTYYLEEFEERGNTVRWDGEPVFAPLTPRDSAEARQWTRNRRRAFRGSLRHFLLALLNDRVEEEQFRMYRIPRARAHRHAGAADRIPISRDRILKNSADSLHEIQFRGALEIVYNGEAESEAFIDWGSLRRQPRDRQVSRIRLNKRTIHVDEHGEIVEPYGATLYGYFAFTQRMAELLPLEYRPPNTTLAASDPQ